MPKPKVLPKKVQVPTEFFTAASFGTLSGCVAGAWIVTTILCNVFAIPEKITGLIVSILTAFAGMFLSSKITRERVIITFFNGFLVYMTIVGITSFAPEKKDGQVKYSQQPGMEMQVESSNESSSGDIFKSWNPK